MPVHRVQIDDLEEKVAEIEKSERIVGVVAGHGTVLVFTEPKRREGEYETRASARDWYSR